MFWEPKTSKLNKEKRILKKIAVLTSGGDAPGMNACLRAIIKKGEASGYEVYGVVGGYQGLIDGEYLKLTHAQTENIIGLGGTLIKTSRCDQFLTEEGFLKALENYKNQAFEALIVLGGDGSLKGAKKLFDNKINVVGIPCTIDNDLSYTDFTIGFDTAINTTTSLLGNVRETSSSHNRVMVVEVMGRHSGQIALCAGTASGAELILVPEIKVSQHQINKKISNSIKKGEKCVLVVVAEGVASAKEVAEQIKKNLQIDAKSMDLGYVQRGGSPSTFDRILATKMGAEAIKKITQKKFGVALAFKSGEIKALALNQIFKFKSKFDEELYLTNNEISE